MDGAGFRLAREQIQNSLAHTHTHKSITERQQNVIMYKVFFSAGYDIMWLENSGTVLRSGGGELSGRRRASMDREWAERWNYNDNTSTKCMYNYKVKR